MSSLKFLIEPYSFTLRLVFNLFIFYVYLQYLSLIYIKLCGNRPIRLDSLAIFIFIFHITVLTHQMLSYFTSTVFIYYKPFNYCLQYKNLVYIKKHLANFINLQGTSNHSIFTILLYSLIQTAPNIFHL
jgi:hypothetical protein